MSAPIFPSVQTDFPRSSARAPYVNTIFEDQGFRLWSVGACEACCREPGTCMNNFFCLCCVAHRQRQQTLTEAESTHFRCCDQGGPGTWLFCNCFDSCCVCPRSPCLCLEAWCCTLCSVFATRERVQRRLKVRNSDWDSCVITSVTASSSSAATGLGAILACALDCCCLACMMTQVQKELDSNQNAFMPGPQQQRMVEMQ